MQVNTADTRQDPDQDSALAAVIRASSRELLDLSLRNPLLNYRPLRARGVETVGHDAAKIFHDLVAQDRPIRFLPEPEPPEPPLPEAENIPGPEYTVQDSKEEDPNQEQAEVPDRPQVQGHPPPGKGHNPHPRRSPVRAR